MRSKRIVLITFLISILSCAAENSRYVTVTGTNGAASITVQEGETGELISLYATTSYFMVSKNGVLLPAVAAMNNYNVGTIVAGPATFQMICGSAPAPCYMTVKLTPATYDVNKTLILPPGTNRVYIALESSTNLLSWADATNGVYGSPDTARFFRIRMESQH